MQKRFLFRIFISGVALLSMVGCAPSSYQVKSPIPSTLRLEGSAPAAKSTFGLVDKRVDTERVFSSGRLPATLTINNVEIDPPKFLSEALQQELVARGVPVTIGIASADTPKIDLRAFNVLNHRATGFSPFVTLTFLAVDLDTGANKTRLGVFIKRGKVPVWSFDEIVEPTFNQPLSLAVKELAAKVARHYYGYRSSDAAVDELVQKIKVHTGEDAYLNVYSLGFSNNPRAIETMVKLTSDQDEYVRLTAISSLGILQAKDKFDLLNSIYKNRGNIWQDRAMAIKAIGDLGTPESKKMLAEELKYWEDQPRDNESTWTSQIIRLYL